MDKTKIYLDICCFNRPYDDQTQQRIQFEAVAKLMIQSLIVEGKIDFVWSYVLEFENSKNPFLEKRNTILAFKPYAIETVHPNPAIESMANTLQNKGVKAYDSLHIACAIFSGCDYFLTVDKKVLNKSSDEIKITDPVIFLNQWLKERSSI
jgi:predicted nucleic acid-binding protein